MQFSVDGGTALTAPQTLNLHRTEAITPHVIEVDGKWSEVVGGRTIEAYSLDNPHAAGYLIPYIPDAKMAFQTDLWTANQANLKSVPADPVVAAFLDDPPLAIVNCLQEAGVEPEKLAGGHGTVGEYAGLVKYVELVKASKN